MAPPALPEALTPIDAHAAPWVQVPALLEDPDSRRRRSLLDNSSGRRSLLLRQLLQTTTAAWTPTTTDRYRPTNYPATWDWRSCKVAASNAYGCYTGAVTGGVTTGSAANTNISYITTVRDQV